MDEPDLETVVRRLGGVARRTDLVRIFSAEQIDAALASGILTRTTRGRYSTHDANANVAKAHSVGGVLGGLSAAQHHGWAVKFPPKKPTVIVPRNRPLVRADLDVRRHDVDPGAVEGAVLDRAHTVVDCARTLPFDEALSVADSALSSGKVNRHQLLSAAQTSPRSGRPRAMRVAECADGRADNPFESVTRAIALGVPGLEVEPQVQVGDIGRVDLADRHLRIAIECESWAHHSGEQPFRVDIRRYTRLVCAGWLVVRFVWEDVMLKPQQVERALHAVTRVRAEQDAWPSRPTA